MERADAKSWPVCGETYIEKDKLIVEIGLTERITSRSAERSLLQPQSIIGKFIWSFTRKIASMNCGISNSKLPLLVTS